MDFCKLQHSYFINSYLPHIHQCHRLLTDASSSHQVFSGFDSTTSPTYQHRINMYQLIFTFILPRNLQDLTIIWMWVKSIDHQNGCFSILWHPNFDSSPYILSSITGSTPSKHDAPKPAFCRWPFFLLWVCVDGYDNSLAQYHLKGTFPMNSFDPIVVVVGTSWIL